jgi:hypothetical protein
MHWTPFGGSAISRTSAVAAFITRLRALWVRARRGTATSHQDRGGASNEQQGQSIK